MYLRMYVRMQVGVCRSVIRPRGEAIPCQGFGLACFRNTIKVPACCRLCTRKCKGRLHASLLLFISAGFLLGLLGLSYSHMGTSLNSGPFLSPKILRHPYKKDPKKGPEFRELPPLTLGTYSHSVPQGPHSQKRSSKGTISAMAISTSFEADALSR